MFSQTEILLMIFVVSILLIFIIVLTVLDILEYRKNKGIKVDDLEEDSLEPAVMQDEVTIMEVEDENIVEQTNNVVYDKVNDEDLFVELEEDKEATLNYMMEPVEVKMEEEKIEPLVVSEIEENPIEPVVNNIVETNNIVEPEITYSDYANEMPKRVNLNEELSKVEETMVSEDEIEKKALSFEEEQERTAIISLDELMQKSDDLYNENEVVQYDDGNEPISIDEIINMYNKEEKEINIPEVQAIVEEKNEEPVMEKKELYTKKEEIPFISSVYGIEKNEMSFENTATYEKLDREKTNEFMRELKERIENQ